jgi:hypothetical protein
MPTRSEQREAFLAKHPFCVFCGGSRRATTIEHCPPRSLFQFKHWPETFEFPACLSCNEGTGDHDAIVAMIARMHPDENIGNADGRVNGLIKNVGAQVPGLLPRMIPSHIEARRRNRVLGIKPGPGQLHQDVAPVTVPDEINEAVETFARKLSKAIYFRETGKSFPNSGAIVMHWFTNVELVRNGKYVLFEQLQSLDGHAPKLVRSGKYLDDQFEFKISLSEDQQVFIAQVRVGLSFGMIIYASTDGKVLEGALSQLESKYQHNGPFSVLQASGAA